MSGVWAAQASCFLRSKMLPKEMRRAPAFQKVMLSARKVKERLNQQDFWESQLLRREDEPLSRSLCLGSEHSSFCLSKFLMWFEVILS